MNHLSDAIEDTWFKNREKIKTQKYGTNQKFVSELTSILYLKFNLEVCYI